jgi:hypothetical protein
VMARNWSTSLSGDKRSGISTGRRSGSAFLLKTAHALQGLEILVLSVPRVAEKVDVLDGLVEDDALGQWRETGRRV